MPPALKGIKRRPRLGQFKNTDSPRTVFGRQTAGMGGSGGLRVWPQPGAGPGDRASRERCQVEVRASALKLQENARAPPRPKVGVGPDPTQPSVSVVHRGLMGPMSSQSGQPTSGFQNKQGRASCSSRQPQTQFRSVFLSPTRPIPPQPRRSGGGTERVDTRVLAPKFGNGSPLLEGLTRATR